MPDRDHPSHSASQRELGGSLILMGLTSGVREHTLAVGTINLAWIRPWHVPSQCGGSVLLNSPTLINDMGNSEGG